MAANGDATKRPIRTDYYLRKKLVKSTYASHANNAVPHATRHMQTNDYSATVCEVYDLMKGEVHAVITCRLVHGKLHMETIFKLDIEGRA